MRKVRRFERAVTTCLILAVVFPMAADPVRVRHVRGFLHGFIVLKDSDDNVLASGTVTQTPLGNRVTMITSLHFKDGSLYEETSVLSQGRTFQLLSYKQVQKGPAFKVPETTLSFETSTGNVTVLYADRDGKKKAVSDHLSLPPDLANGILPILMTDIDPKVETTLSMVVSTPKPRVVKLKIAAGIADAFSAGGSGFKATHYVVKIDLGGITAVVAKVAGKQPPPIDMWVSAGVAPAFLRSDGPLYEDGPIWRIELASPVWARGSKR
jgi:hypothetical protein